MRIQDIVQDVDYWVQRYINGSTSIDRFTQAIVLTVNVRGIPRDIGHDIVMQASDFAGAGRGKAAR